ncbi:LacI family DNA-binding transcriptional regulator [Cohnella sp. 56]|uniref:LacI family DNA-binding transcriptional regulator n=1 Tax=Cohnella sp. 56 TaxID=3113722 RepID=UPI0030EAD070
MELEKREPTIKDIAQKTGVSIATVSRVIHGLTGYSDKTRELVMKAAEELGYRPNAIARGLVSRRTQTIGVLFPQVSGSYSAELLHGIEEAANERGFSIIVCNTAREGERTMKYLRVLREKQVDGIVFASQFVLAAYEQELAAMRVPVMLVNTLPERSDLSYIKVDDREASREATEHLVRLGHREIAMIAGTPDDPVAGQPRVDGYRDALEAGGIAYREALVACGGFCLDGGRRAMERLLADAPSLTAVFAASDEMAAGALAAALERGLRVPDDLSIVGYDDLIFARMVHPPLTTIRQPLSEMGRLATERLIARIKGEPYSDGSIIVAHTLVKRDSAGEPPSGPNLNIND